MLRVLQVVCMIVYDMWVILKESPRKITHQRWCSDDYGCGGGRRWRWRVKAMVDDNGDTQRRWQTMTAHKMGWTKTEKDESRQQEMTETKEWWRWLRKQKTAATDNNGGGRQRRQKRMTMAKEDSKGGRRCQRRTTTACNIGQRSTTGEDKTGRQTTMAVGIRL